MTEPMAMEGAALARLVAMRLVHDLAGPLGSIAAAAGLAPGAARSDEILGETVTELMARGRLYAAVFGQAEPASMEDMAAMLAGAPGAHRIQFDVAAAPADTSPPVAQIMLTAAMLAAEALPRGGRVIIGTGPGGGALVMPEGRMAAWPHALIERLGGLAPPQPDTPRSLLAPWLIALAREAGCQLSVGLGGPGIPPLLLRPPQPARRPALAAPG